MPGLGFYPIGRPRRSLLGTIIPATGYLGYPRLLEDTIEQPNVGDHGREMPERVGDGKWANGDRQKTSFRRNALGAVHDGTP